MVYIKNEMLDLLPRELPKPAVDYKNYSVGGIIMDHDHGIKFS